MPISDSAFRLKRLRDFLGYSQRELAQEFQVTSGAIAHWETGVRPIPGPIEKLISIYEQALSIRTEDASLISQEALQASRDLLKDVIQALRAQGISISEPEKEGILNFVKEYVGGDFAKFRSGGIVKLALVKQMLKTFEGSPGLAVKAAQLASFMEMGLASEVSVLLGDLQTKVRPLLFSQICEVLRETYRNFEDIFTEVSPIPLAVTSIAQLHRAKLKSGEAVVLKVQNPKIRSILMSQFRKISFLNFLGKLLGSSADEVIREIEEQIFSELDYEREVFNQERFRNIFDHEPRIVIPKVFRELCGKYVIVSEYQPGLSFDSFAARATSFEKNKAALLIAYFHSYAIFNKCLMHGDAHPGNFLFRDDKVIFLDFGRVVEFDLFEIEKEKNLYRSIIFKNKKKFIEHFIDNGLISKPGDFDFDGFWRVVLKQQHHHLVDGAFRITRDYIRSGVLEIRSFEDRKKIFPNKTMLRASVVNGSLWSLFARLEAEAHWRSQAITILK